MATQYGVSRKLLYQIRDKAEAGIVSSLLPHRPGRKPKETNLSVDKRHLDRSIVTMATAVPASVRGIQHCLREMLGMDRSLGYISETLKQAGECASELNSHDVPNNPVLAEADEIFHCHKPCLTLVDGHSFMVLHLSPQSHRDSTTWGVSLLDVMDEGVVLGDIASDGAKGIKGGIEEAGVNAPFRPDLFHLIRKGYRVAEKLESDAYKSMAEADKIRSRQVSKEVSREVKTQTDRRRLRQAQQREEEAIEHYDSFVWLLREIRRSLDPWQRGYRLTSSSDSRDTIQTALRLMMNEIVDLRARRFACDTSAHINDLISPLQWLEDQLEPLRSQLDTETEAAIIWSFRHRDELCMEARDGFPQELGSLVEEYWRVLGLFHRSSSLAESFHSWLRPYLQVHRGMPVWLMPLMRLYWNHHSFSRGKRKGKMPVELAGVTEALEWDDILNQIVNQKQSSPQAA
jgi:hypothetical protein